MRKARLNRVISATSTPKHNIAPAVFQLADLLWYCGPLSPGTTGCDCLRADRMQHLANSYALIHFCRIRVIWCSRPPDANPPVVIRSWKDFA